MSGLNCDTCHGTVDLAGVTMHGEAWCFYDLSELWLGPDWRGDDQLVPHVEGERPKKKRAAKTVYNLPLVVWGQVDGQTGDPWDHAHESPHAQLLANWRYLQENVLRPRPTITSETALVWVLPDGHIRNVLVHVKRPTGLRFGGGGDLDDVLLTCTVPISALDPLYV